MGLNDDVLTLVYTVAAKAADVEPAVAAAGGLRLLGWSIRESAGSEAVATARIMNGATVSGGTAVAQIELAASNSESQWLWPGIDCQNGISFDRIAGTFDICIYWAIMHNRP